jgi:AraC family transcriptional regulator, regulatory protein of adaptative response / DNA-3-methyladenine glycosylase II
VLRPFVMAAPGTRLPGVIDGWAATVLAVLAQGVALSTARVLAGRIATTLGPPSGSADPDLGRLFPEPDVIADADLSSIGLPVQRQTTLRALAREIAAGRIELDEGADPEATLRALRALPGIGPWTAGYVALRVLRDPDTLPEGDAALRSAFRLLGLPADDRAIMARAEAWRPWRGYAVIHLWGSVR